MSKRKNSLQLALYIYLSFIFTITFVVGFIYSIKPAMITICILLIPFFVGQALIYGLTSQIRGVEMILKNLPNPGEKIDLSIYYRNHLLISGPAPFVVEYPNNYELMDKSSIRSRDAYGPFEFDSFTKVHPRITKPASKDFEDIYIQARDGNITDLHKAYDLWVNKYPQRVLELVDPWSSFKHGMETQEKLNGVIFDREI